jgi:hypothetical protein
MVKDDTVTNNVEYNRTRSRTNATSENSQTDKTSSKANEIQEKSKANNTSKASSKDDTASQEIQNNKLIQKEEKRKRKYESVKSNSSLEPEEAQENEVVVPKKSSIKQDQVKVKKSNSQSVYNNPDFRKILNSLQTSKYIPCGYDKDGKITKALRVIS